MKAPRSSSRLRWLALGLGAVVLVLLLGAAVDAVRIKHDVDSGQATLDGLSLATLGEGLGPTVHGAAVKLERADDRAHSSIFFAALHQLPWLHRQIDGVRDLTSVAAELGQTADAAATAIGDDLDKAGGEPTARVRLLDTTIAQIDTIEAAVKAIDLGSQAGLVGPLDRARANARHTLDELPDRLEEAKTRAAAVRRLIAGPSRYLVLAANNAEMRGGYGMPLTGGIATFTDGDIDFGTFQSVANHFAGPIDPALVPPEYKTTYRQFRMGVSWLQSAVSPNFTVLGPMYQAMSATFPGFGPVDGVIMVDAVTLARVLEVIGPVNVDGVRYTAGNVEQKVLNANYLAVTSKSSEGGEGRREVQGRIATGIFNALKGRNVDLAPLANGLLKAASGRHLLAFSSDQATQELWDAVGATGALYSTGLMVTVQNIAADKLDWYINPRVDITAVPTLTTSDWRVRLTVNVPNPTRKTSSVGVESYKPGYANGIHRAMVAIYLPASATNITTPDGHFSEAGWDRPMLMVAERIFIDEGDEGHVSVSFTMPKASVGAILLPSGRVRPVVYTVNGHVTNDAVPGVVFWPELPQPDHTRRNVTALLALLAIVAVVSLAVSQRRRLRPR